MDEGIVTVYSVECKGIVQNASFTLAATSA